MPTHLTMNKNRRRLGSLCALALFGLVSLGACAKQDVVESGPRATIELLPVLSFDPPSITTPASGTIQVTATAMYPCEDYRLLPRLVLNGAEVTLRVEGHLTAWCPRDQTPVRRYRATVSDLSAGTWQLRIVHTVPAAGIVVAPDTIFNGAVDVP